jgi:hemerythrin-like domain-containing protein
MKRHDALIPLTHDHHHALVQARRLLVAATSEPDQRLVAAREFIDFYDRDTLAHFREEEELIFPLVVDREEAEASLTRLMMEHLRIHALVRRVAVEIEQGDLQTATMTSLSDLLEAHIRFEEKTVFPMIEELAADLASVHLAHRDRTPKPADSL